MFDFVVVGGGIAGVSCVERVKIKIKKNLKSKMKNDLFSYQVLLKKQMKRFY